MLRETHTSTVTEDQIDHLGHMNVMYYAVNARAATRALVAGLPGWGTLGFMVHDTYTRHFREQLLGSPLVVRSAVLGVTDEHLRLHHELANSETGELAATFVHVLHALDEAGRPTPLPANAVAAARDEVVPTPDHAAPRSISLDVDLLERRPSLELLRERGLEMRRERRVGADECDAAGDYRPDMLAMLTWGGEPLEDDPDEMLHETSAGVVMGWAVMENRIQLGRLPRVGTRIQTFAATVAIHDKVMQRIHWTFDLDTGDALTVFENVSVAFDIGGRRAMTIPEGYREKVLGRLQPDLASRTTA